MAKVRVVLEVAPKRSFASALDWPGWSRGGKTPDESLEALLAYAPALRRGRAPREGRVPAAGDRARASTSSSDGRAAAGPSSACPANRRPWRPSRSRAPSSSGSSRCCRPRGRPSTRRRRRRRASSCASGRAAVGARSRRWSGTCARPSRRTCTSSARRPPRGAAGTMAALRKAFVEALTARAAGTDVPNAEQGQEAVEPALRRAPLRLARPRPRLGDRGPLDR